MEQLIYTSCRTGINNSGSGFQVYSHSPGMSSDMVLNAQRYICRYKEPFSLPAKPTPEQIEQLFPRAFKFMPLDGEHLCVCGSAYTGRDYMGDGGRFGNFISHVICFKNEDFDGYPISLCESELFERDLPEECKNSPDVPQMLCQIDAQTVNARANESMSFDSVREFINGEDGRIEYLKMLDAALLESERTGKRIIICDERQNIPYWIAAVTMSFSQKTSMSIYFSTYEYDPDSSDAAICGVYPEGTGYELKNAKASGLYYVFDFICGDFPEIDTDKEFLELVQAGFEFSADSLLAFFEFSDGIGLNKADGRVYAAYELYRIFDGTDRIKKADDLTVQLVISLIAGDGEQKICSEIAERAELAVQLFDGAQLARIFAAAIKTTARKPEIIPLAYRMIFAVLGKVCESDPKNGRMTAVKIYRDASESCVDGQEEFFEFLFERDGWLYNYVPLILKIRLLAEYLQTTDTDVAEYARSDKGRDTAADLFRTVEELAESEYAEFARDAFCGAGGNAAKLMEIFKAATEDEQRLSISVRAFLNGFCTEGAPQIEDIQYKYECAMSFIKKEKIYPQVVFCFVEEIEKDISFDLPPWEQWEFIKPIYEYKKEFAIPSTVNKSELIRAAEMIKRLGGASRAAADKLAREFKKLPFDGVELAQQKKYIDFVFPCAARLIKDDGGNLSAVMNMFAGADGGILCSAAADNARAQAETGRAVIALVAAFWAYSEWCDKIDMRSQYDRISEIARQMNKRRLAQADVIAADRLDIKGAKRWIELSEHIKGEKKGFISSLMDKLKNGG